MYIYNPGLLYSARESAWDSALDRQVLSQLSYALASVNLLEVFILRMIVNHPTQTRVTLKTREISDPRVPSWNCLTGAE